MTRALNIKWETDGQDISLPSAVEIPDYVVREEYDVADYLSNTIGWLVVSFDLDDE